MTTLSKIHYASVGIDTEFVEGKLVRHVKSGKLYRVLGIVGRDAFRIGVVGVRDGADFGPVRFIDAGRLRPL